MYNFARYSTKGKRMSHFCLRALFLLLILVGAYSATPKTAAAAVTSIPLGCAASEFGQNIVIPLSNDVPEGAAIVVAVQVIARNEDLTGIVDPAGNSYTRQVKHLGFEVGTSVKENYTLHVYTASDAKALKKGQAITVQWSYANQLEACAVAINGVTRTPVDQRAENHAEIQAESAALDSLNTSNTTTPNQVLVGAFGWFCVDLEKRVVCDATSTPGADYTEVLEGQDVMLQTRNVTAAGAYKATATLNKTAASSAYKATFEWNAAIITLKVDSTPPVLGASNIAGTMGQNGWYTSNIVVTWSATDPESRITTPPCSTTISTDMTDVNISCTATSAGGSSTSPSVTVKRDATPPTIKATVAPGPNASGWHNSDVTVSYTCTDALSGLAAACPAPQVVSAEGNAAMPTISDLAGNKSVAGVSARIDKSAPVVAVTGVNNGATYVVGSVPAATCSTTDALSGVATQATAAVTGGGPDGLGIFTATCSVATDRAGNSSQPVTITYTVTLPPTPTPTPLPPGGTVNIWGDNTYGQLNMPAGLNEVVKIATGYRHTLALKNNGTVVAWGYNAYGQSTVPAGLTEVIGLSAGDRHSLALKRDGTVIAWGENSAGQLNIPAGLNNVVAIASGPYHNLALKRDGTVVGWGSNWSGETAIPAGLSNVTAIATGMGFGVALKGDGTVVVWGDNTYQQLNVPTGLSGVIKIATGRLHTLAIKGDSSVVAWGYNCCYQIAVPAGLTGVSAVAGGGYHSLALKSDGTLVSWGDNTKGQRTLPAGLGGVAAMSAGGFHTVLLSQPTGFLGGGGAAGGAVVAAAESLSATLPMTLVQLLEEPSGLLPTAVISEPAAVEAAPVVTESVLVSVPVVVETPAVTTTQPITSVDANVPAASDTSGQNQQLFLPIITNVAAMAGAALGSPGGLATLVVVVLLMVGGLVWRRRGGGR